MGPLQMTTAADYYAALRSALDAGPPPALEHAADVLYAAHERGNVTYTFGNGASAALASHIATDLGKGLRLRVVSLVDNAALVTAYANDQNYDCVFEEQLRRVIRPGDVAFGISASGRSRNVLAAVEHAADQNAHTVGFTGGGAGGELMAARCQVLVRAPLEEIEQIEDLHVVFAHILMRLLRERLA